MVIHLEYKQKFREKYSRLTDFDSYWNAVQKFTPKTIRTNTLRISPKELREKLTEKDIYLKEIPWCKEAFEVEGKPPLGDLEEHKQGLFFVQNSVSILPALVLQPEQNEIVLDMAASPGAKTTQMASMMNNQGAIIANDSSSSRVKILQLNIQRCGVMNTIVTQSSGNHLKPKFMFDKILLDAPCSASGLIKGPTEVSSRTLKEWNPNTILRMAKLQKVLLLHAYSLLKPNGILVYSTCSLEPEEDENVINTLLKKTDAQLLSVKLPLKFQDEKYFKLWPQHYNTFGFFIAKIRKPE